MTTPSNSLKTHASILGVMMIAHGVILLLYAGFAVFAVGFLLIALSFPELEADMNPTELSLMTGLYGVLFCWNLVIGMFNVVGGLSQRRMVKRPLSILAILMGMGTVFGACTLPLAVIIGLYGLFVHVQIEVQRSSIGPTEGE